MTTITKIAEELVNLKVKEVQELLKVLKEEHNIEPAAAAPVAVAATSEESTQEEKTDVDIFIKAIGTKKMELIKAVKTVTGVGLIDAKKLVDAHTESAIKKSVPKAEATKIKEVLEAAGATIEIK